ncbi:MAG: hypothetical protein AB1894_13855 [Chloroflexota bacterium]
MSVLFPDTRPEAEAVLIDLLRQAPGWRKLHMVGQLNAAVQSLALSGLRQRYPQATSQELRRRLAELLLGSELALKAYGPLPDVDIFVRKDRPFDRAQFERRSEMVVATQPERKAYIASAEDTILAKLEWYRLGNEVSERQWRDVLGMLKVQAGRLDFAYLHLWAERLNILDLLERALAQAGEERAA